MMIKITLKLVRSTRDCLAHARRLLLTYSIYAFYSFRDRKGRQLVDDKSLPLNGPRHSLLYYHVEDFLLSQWSDNAVPYAIYRSIVAAYFFFMVFYTAIFGTLKIYMFIMLTYWSYYILAAAQILRAVNSWYYVSLQKKGEDAKSLLRNSRRIKLQWVLHNIGSNAAPLVSVLFWTIAYDGSGFTLINCTTHGLNALFVLVDTLVTRTPVRMLHFYQCTTLGLIYGLFSSLYWLVGGTNHLGQPYIYKPLDFSRLNMALSTILLSAFVAAPIIHCWIFFLYRFRLFIHRYLRVMEKRNGESATEKVQ